MTFSWNKYWPVYIFGATLLIALGWVIYCEINISCFSEYNGRIVGKHKIRPKELPNLVVNGSARDFPLWKWGGIEYDSVQIGDSIVKKKYETEVLYLKKIDDKIFKTIRLKYWTSW